MMSDSNKLGRNLGGALVAVGLAWAGVDAARAALGAMEKEYSLLGDIPGHQQWPHVALGPSGGFVAWQSEALGSGGERILFQAVDKDFRAMRVPLRVSQADDGRLELNARVAMMKDGGAVVAWEAGVRADRDIYLRFIAPNGSFLTTDIRVNTYTSGIQGDPVLAVLGNGDVVVAWVSREQDGSGTGIFGQHFTAQGTKSGAEFRVNVETKRNQSSPALAALADGGFMTAWISESVTGQSDDGAPNLRSNLTGLRFDRKGAAQGGELRLNQGNAVCSEPVLAGFAGGGFAAAWVQLDETRRLNQGDIFARRFNASGAPAGDARRQNANTAGFQHSPSLAVLKDDGLVAWDHRRFQSSGREVHGRLLSGGAEFRLNTRLQMPQMHVAVAGDGESRWLAAWVDFLKPRHSVLSGRVFRLGGLPDITAGAHVVDEKGPSRVVIRGQTGRKADPVKSQLNDKAAEQILAAERQADEAAMAAARVAQQAAAEQASNTLQQMAADAARAPAPVAQPLRGFGMESSGFRQNLMGTAPGPTAIPDPTAVPPGLRRRQGDLDVPSLQLVGVNTLRDRARSRMSPEAVKAMSTLVKRQDRPTGRGINFPQMGRRPGLSPDVTRRLTSSRPSITDRRLNPATFRPSTMGGRTGGDWSSIRPLPGNGSGTGRLRLVDGRLRLPGGQLTAPQRVRNSRPSLADRMARSSQPVAAQLVRNGRDMQVQWNTQRGRNYQVQGSRDLRSWQNMSAIRSGTGSQQRAPINNGSGMRYYRVMPR